MENAESPELPKIKPKKGKKPLWVTIVALGIAAFGFSHLYLSKPKKKDDEYNPDIDGFV